MVGQVARRNDVPRLIVLQRLDEAETQLLAVLPPHQARHDGPHQQQPNHNDLTERQQLRRAIRATTPGSPRDLLLRAVPTLGCEAACASALQGDAGEQETPQHRVRQMLGMATSGVGMAAPLALVAGPVKLRRALTR
jgi:hypothetical protein